MYSYSGVLGQLTGGQLWGSHLVCALVLALTASFALPSQALAQDDDSMDLTGDDSMDLTGGDADEDTEDFQEDEGSVVDSIANSEGDGSLDVDTSDEAKLIEQKEEIYAIQRRQVLRKGRVELMPSLGFTVNDPYVSHTSINLGLKIWWTNVLAIGLSFNWYEGLQSESDLNYFVRRGTRLAIPITEWQMGGYLNFSYVPLYGKFTMFREFIFQYNLYVVGGVGFMRTRPIPIIDPEVRSFEYDWRVAFNVGIGMQIFLTRWLSTYIELRDYLYLEQYENLNVGVGPISAEQDAGCNAANKSARECESTWLASGSTLNNAITFHVGLTFFIPTDFDYTTPK